MPTPWRVYQRETIAARLAVAEMPGFLRKQIVVGPHEAAIVVRDGQPGEVLTETRAKVSDVFERIKSWFGLNADISVYFLDLAPFEISLFLGESTTTTENRTEASFAASGTAQTLAAASRGVGWQMEGTHETSATHYDASRVTIVALSADREIVQASCHLRLRLDLDPDEPTEGAVRVMSLLKGKRALATWDVAALLRDEVLARVLVPEIAMHSAGDLRTNPALPALLEARTRENLDRSLAACGLRVERFSIAWGLTESEKAEIARARAEREEKALDFAKSRRVAQLQREQEIEKLRLQNLQELKTAQARGDQELKDLLLAGDLGRDLTKANHEVDLAKVDARIRDVTLEVEKKESLARLEQRRSPHERRPRSRGDSRGRCQRSAAVRLHRFGGPGSRRRGCRRPAGRCGCPVRRRRLGFAGSRHTGTVHQSPTVSGFSAAV